MPGLPEPSFDPIDIPLAVDGADQIACMEAMLARETGLGVDDVRSMAFDIGDPFQHARLDTRLYDLRTDPGQESPLSNAEAEARMIGYMKALMRSNDAPPEAFVRLKL